jgi:hypothetical protein
LQAWINILHGGIFIADLPSIQPHPTVQIRPVLQLKNAVAEATVAEFGGVQRNLHYGSHL